MHEHTRAWLERATAAGWTLDDLEEDARTFFGDDWENALQDCEHCGAPVMDPVMDPVLSLCDGCAIHLTAEDGIGIISLCEECYDRATEARTKITVDSDGYEDWNALSDDERDLADLLERAQRGESRMARTHIASYPTREQAQLRRYQDAIDYDASVSGKTTAKN